MYNKTFKQLYNEEKSKDTPAQAFIANVAKLTCRSKVTVKMWLAGMQTPDELTTIVIAKHFGCKAETLFPKKTKTKKV